MPEGIFGPRTKKSEVEWAILSYTARQPPIFAIYAPPQDTYQISTLVFALKSNCNQIDDRIYLSFNMGLLSKNLHISKVI